MSILLGILSSFLGSITDSIWKKAVLLSKLPQSLFSIFGPIGGIIIVYTIIIYNKQSLTIINDYKSLLLILLIAIISFLVTNLYISIYKKVKLSELLPYNNLDKIFIVLFGFVLFYGTKNSTSITSFIITLLTIFIIIGFNINPKKIKFSKNIGLFVLVKILEALITLIVGYIFIKYTTVEYIAIEAVLFLSIAIIASIILKNNLILLFKQEKDFYKYRLGAGLIGWSGFLIGLYIIETSGVLIGTLISFIGLIFQILSMKFILKDTPEKKQIILAVIVMFMIGLGYYFK